MMSCEHVVMETTAAKQPVKDYKETVSRERLLTFGEIFMQETGVIEPSGSPWSGPVVIVMRRGRTLSFCVDYRVPHSVTK